MTLVLHGALVRQRTRAREEIAEAISRFAPADAELPLPPPGAGASPDGSDEQQPEHPQARPARGALDSDDDEGHDGAIKGERKGLEEVIGLLERAESDLGAECETIAREVKRLEVALTDAARKMNRPWPSRDRHNGC
jgi:hypothetical protein